MISRCMFRFTEPSSRRYLKRLNCASYIKKILQIYGLFYYNGLILALISFYINKNSVAFSPQANYTDKETAASRRNLVPTFAVRGVSRDQRGESPTVGNPSYLDRIRYFFFQLAPHLSSRGSVDPVPDPLLLRKCDSAWNRTWDLWLCRKELWPLNYRGGAFLYQYKI
jgi:hypothetical protein